MKVINSKGGVKARSVNDRAIEHSISQKTELSKKNEREITGKPKEPFIKQTGTLQKRKRETVLFQTDLFLHSRKRTELL